MPTLHIEHPITDFDTWSSAFGRFAEIQRLAGVRRAMRPASGRGPELCGGRPRFQQPR
jgi:hypothetical protein